MAPSPKAIRDEMDVATVGPHDDTVMTFALRISNTGQRIMTINGGPPIGRHGSELGWAPVYEHFALHMIELAKQLDRQRAGGV